jgi:hypothetical protein
MFCLNHPLWFDRPNNIWRSLAYIVMHSSQASCHFVLLRFKYLLSTLFSNTLYLYARDQFLHPNKTKQNKQHSIVSHILIFAFLVMRWKDWGLNLLNWMIGNIVRVSSVPNISANAILICYIPKYVIVVTFSKYLFGLFILWFCRASDDETWCKEFAVTLILWPNIIC